MLRRWFVPILVASGSLAAAPAVDVYPTGTAPLDASNVQAALDRGGVVRLKALDFSRRPAAFDFGGDTNLIGSVLLRADVEIVGDETDGGARTTIPTAARFSSRARAAS